MHERYFKKSIQNVLVHILQAPPMCEVTFYDSYHLDGLFNECVL